MPVACLAPSVPAGPLSALAHAHEHSAGPCAALAGLLVAGAAADPRSNAVALQLLAHFDADALGHQARETRLFPLLLESTAGPETIHVRRMTQKLAAQHRALQTLWLPLRLPLACLALGARPALDAAQVQGFLRLQRRHQACEARQLLPLVAALFTDAELAWRQHPSFVQQLRPGYPAHWH